MEELYQKLCRDLIGGMIIVMTTEYGQEGMNKRRGYDGMFESLIECEGCVQQIPL